MRLLLVMLSCLLLAGCPERAQTASDAAAAQPAAAPAPAPAPEPPAAPAPAPGASPREALDVSCQTDADCEVKDIGSCCGYYPRCVNANAQTDPAGVQADCEREGRMSICGFPAISGCTCNAGQCENVTSPVGVGEALPITDPQPQ